MVGVLVVLDSLFFFSQSLQCCDFLLNFSFYFRSPLLQALIGLFELPQDESTHPDDHFIEVDDTPGYTVAYSQLNFANKEEYDPLGGMTLICGH